MSTQLQETLRALRVTRPPYSQEIVFIQSARTAWWITPIDPNDSATERALEVVAGHFHTTRDQAYMWVSGFITPHMLHVKHGTLHMRRWVAYSQEPLLPCPTPARPEDSRAAVALLDALASARDLGDTMYALQHSTAPALLREWLEAVNMVR